MYTENDIEYIENNKHMKYKTNFKHKIQIIYIGDALL